MPQSAALKALNPRQRKFLKFYIQTGNGAASARKAGYKDDQVTPYQILGNPRFQSAYQELLDKNGVTDQRLINVLKDGLKAKKLMGEKLVECDDHQTRHKYLETGLKLRGRLDEKKDDEATTPMEISVQVIHVRRHSDISSSSKQGSDSGDRVIIEAGASDGLEGQITSSVRRVQIG